jgi:hypothetical protein
LQQVHRRDEQCPQAPGAKLLRLGSGGGPEGLRGPAPKHAQILKNSIAFKETANERLFLMKDLAAVEEVVVLGAKILEGEVVF